jgi:hypothetical protein
MQELDGLKDDNGQPLRTNNNPLYLLGPLAKYKLGMASPEGTLGHELSALSLASIQGMMPFASKSRSYPYIKDIGQHLPNVMGNPLHLQPPDSPNQIFAKLRSARRNFLRMDASTMRYETKGAGAQAAKPTLDRDRGLVYLHLADGRPDQAQKMAEEDGWQIPR